MSIRPNILIIVADDLGYNDIGCFGSTQVLTPNINSLATNGQKWTNFYSNGTVCSPTRASLLTGRYPEEVGMPGVPKPSLEQTFGYLDDVVTMPEILNADADYHTALIGKWHLGYEAPNIPNMRGFQHFHGFLGAAMSYFTHLETDDNVNRMYLNQDLLTNTGGTHATDLFTQWMIDYLDSRIGESNPFMAFLNYTAPHNPLEPTTASLSAVQSRLPSVSPTRQKLIALIEHMDAGIGQVLNKLSTMGITNDTLIFFMSDNGGYLPSQANNGTNKGYKFELYEGGIHVPMIVKYPGVVPAGTTTSRGSMTMDIPVSILNALELDLPEVNGHNLWNTMTGDTTPYAGREFHWCFRTSNPTHWGAESRAVRLGKYKLVMNQPYSGGIKLFDLGADPGETIDLSTVLTAKRDEMLGLMMTQIKKGGKVRWQP